MVAEPIDWSVVAAWVIVPFALFATQFDRYRSFERGHLRGARTVSFGAASVIAAISLALAVYSASETIRTIELIAVAVSLGFGVRFSWLADKAEALDKAAQAKREADLRAENRELFAKIGKIEEHHRDVAMAIKLQLKTRAATLIADVRAIIDAPSPADVDQAFRRTVLPHLEPMIAEFNHYGIPMKDLLGLLRGAQDYRPAVLELIVTYLGADLERLT